MRSRTPIDVIRWNGKRKPTLKELTDSLDVQGVEWALYTDAPKVKYGRHKHDFDDFIVIVAGRMKIGVNSEEWIMNVGDRIDLPAHTVHWAEVVGESEVQYLSSTF
jgi:quercetin dioxygenase-like cupin family protein